MKSKTILTLMILSVVLFAIGCYPPVAAKTVDPYFGYLLFPITLPAWILTGLFGVILGIKCKTETLYTYKVSNFGWCMLLLSIAGFVSIWFIPFYAS